MFMYECVYTKYLKLNIFLYKILVLFLLGNVHFIKVFF